MLPCCAALACFRSHAFLLAALFLFVLSVAPWSVLFGVALCIVCGAMLALGLGSWSTLSGAMSCGALFVVPCCCGLFVVCFFRRHPESPKVVVV